MEILIAESVPVKINGRGTHPANPDMPASGDKVEGRVAGALWNFVINAKESIAQNSISYQ